jgi:hypothetical protein
MKKYPEYLKVVSVLLVFVLIISTNSCTMTKNLPLNEMAGLNERYYVLHGPTSYYKLSNIKLSNGILTGTINYTVTNPNETGTVGIYAAPDSSIKKIGEQVQVPYTNIVKVEKYELDGLKVLTGTISTLAIGFLAFLLLKGGSCPFIYTNNGDSFQFEGEIYSGATASPLERDDYLLIGKLKPVRNQYNLKITNEVNEIQKTNLTDLVVIDHQPGVKILIDKYGIPYTLSNLEMPTGASDCYGNSILNEVSKKDNLRYVSTIKNDANIKDTISLMFDKPAGVTDSRLIINGKNTMWLDYMYVRFSDLFGKRFEKFKEKTNKQPREELLKWSFDQGLPLAVYLQTDSGLRLLDYFNLPGPMADKEDVLQIDLSQVHSDKINLKLVSGMLFWDLDYVGMDFTSPAQFKKTIVPLYSAIDENQVDVKPLLIKDDEKYLIQPLPSNKTDLTFIAPDPIPGMERSIYLHSKGHYEILRETKGKPDIAYLKTFRQPGTFIKFSKDNFLKFCNAN